MRRLAALVALLLLGAGCRSPSVTLIPETDLPADVYGSPRPTPSAEALPRKGTVYLIKERTLLAVRRPLQPVAGSLPEALMLALLQPPRGSERATTAIPPDTTLRAVDVENTVVTVDVSAEFERPGPRRSQALRIAQVVYTLTEDPSPIEAVRFSIDGLAQDAIGGIDLTVIDRPVNRGDYVQFTRS